MTRRLVRVLQRGGVTAQIHPDIWGVWRAKDRRRLSVGILPGREVELMKLNEQLKPLAAPSAEVWVWNDSNRLRPDPTLLQAKRFASPPLLNQLILTAPSVRQSQVMSHAARSFRRDHAQAPVSSRIFAAMSDEDQRFLHALVLADASKSQLSKAYSLRPDAVETKALSILRELAKTYA